MTGLRHHCGLFGIFGHPEAVELTYLGLHAQQHRGQEGAGIVSSDGERLVRHARMGLVSQVLTPEVLRRLRNPHAIGHVRYSTAGTSCDEQVQPMLLEHHVIGPLALGHNGTIHNAPELRRRLEREGQVFRTTADTEVIVHLIARAAGEDLESRLRAALGPLVGAFSLVMLTPRRLVAVRDPLGFRPLCIGRVREGVYVVASETCALDIVEAEYLRDVQPGEMVTIDESGLHSTLLLPPREARLAQCIFEHVYFADPSSLVFGETVHVVRERMGRELAREWPADGDLVIPVPNCARCAALGYSKESGIELGRGFTTSHYAGRSFILPEQASRDLAVRMKLNVIRESVRGRRLVVIEDSVVRGTTTRGKLAALRRAGAREIHLRVASPPIRYPCFYGIDFPDPAELVATGREVEEIRRYLGVDSLGYLSLEGMLRCVSGPPTHYCTACFSGEYPTPTSPEEAARREGRAVVHLTVR